MKFRNHIFLILSLAAVCLVGTTVSAQENTGPLPINESISRADALNIAEATFRYMFEKNGVESKRTTQSYFLSLFGKDPATSFMMRFSNHHPSVWRASEFEIGKGVKFNVSRIKRVSSARVEVTAGYYRSGLAAAGNTYFVELKDGTWFVSGWISKWRS